jgi:RNA-directed DNA polymerase
MTKRPQGSCPPSARFFKATLAPQPIDRGVDFVGQVIKPWHRHTRRRTIKSAVQRIKTIKQTDLYETANSYLGLIGQASSCHYDKCKVAKEILKRGLCVNHAITKAYRHVS